MKSFNMRATNNFWSYRWDKMAGAPVVLFTNPKVRTNIIFQRDELENMVKQKRESLFHRVPLVVMSAALEELSKLQNNICAA